MKPSRRVLWLIIVSAGLSGVSAQTGRAQSHAGGMVQRAFRDADEIEQVKPCCPTRPTAALSEAGGHGPRPQPRPPVRESPFDVETLRRLKDAAASDPAAPAGRHLRLGPAPSQLSRAPGLKASFPGLKQGELGLGAFPPDSQLAVGPEQVLQAVNIAMRLTDRSGGNAFSQTLTEHFGLPPSTGGSLEPTITDPKAYYDPLSKRFFLVILEVDFARSVYARAYLSVSRSSAPTSLSDTDWCKYAISTKLGNTWGDYPGLGMSERWLAISTNNFPFTGSFSSQSRLFVADKTALADNSAGCPTAKFFKFNLRKNDLGEFSVQPAQHYESTGLAGEPLFALSSEVLGGSTYTLFRITTKGGRGAPRPKLARAEVRALERYTFPPQASQSGGGELLETGDPRVMQQAVYRHGRLWFTHATGCSLKGSQTNLACVRVGRIEPGESGGTIDFEDTFGRKKEYFFWPGVAVTPGGDVVAGFLRSGDNKLLGTAYAGMKQGALRFGDAAGLPRGFDNAKYAATGECTLQTQSVVQLPTGERAVRVRTGDYIGIAPDPVTEDVWLTGEHGKFGFGGLSCSWASNITRVRY